MNEFTSVAFIGAVMQIVLIDVLLGGDNAIMIGLACRRLPLHLRWRGVAAGTAGAILTRVLLIFFAIALLQMPYLKLIGGALLIGIGAKLLVSDDEASNKELEPAERFWGAIRIIVIADVAMSMDNVIAIAAAAESSGGSHKVPLVVFGLLVSIPIIVAGSQVVLRLMDRFPAIVTVGAMMLGWIAGTMIVTDTGLQEHLGAVDQIHLISGAVGAVCVFVLGRLLNHMRSTSFRSEAVRDLES